MIKRNAAILSMSLIPAILGLAMLGSPDRGGEVIADERAASIFGGYACPGTNGTQVGCCNGVCPINQQYVSGSNNGQQVDTYASCGTSCGGTYQNSIACTATPTPKPEPVMPTD